MILKNNNNKSWLSIGKYCMAQICIGSTATWYCMYKDSPTSWFFFIFTLRILKDDRNFFQEPRFFSLVIIFSIVFTGYLHYYFITASHLDNQVEKVPGGAQWVTGAETGLGTASHLLGVRENPSQRHSQPPAARADLSCRDAAGSWAQQRLAPGQGRVGEGAARRRVGGRPTWSYGTWDCTPEAVQGGEECSL